MKRIKFFGILTLVIGLSMFLFVGCADDNSSNGIVIFNANGEDFVRDGFTTKDGWAIVFDHVYMNVQGPTAYQVDTTTRHAGHPHTDIPDGTTHVALMGEYFMSLKQDPFEVGRVENALVGNYNYLGFKVQKATTSSSGLVAGNEGYSFVLKGTAVKGITVNFELKFTQEMEYSSCGPIEDDGVLTGGDDTATAEMTFHFDHIFGDVDGPTEVNEVAIGFDPFALLADDMGDANNLNATQTDMQAHMALYDNLIAAVKTLGHTGEAHCSLVE